MQGKWDMKANLLFACNCHVMLQKQRYRTAKISISVVVW